MKLEGLASQRRYSTKHKRILFEENLFPTGQLAVNRTQSRWKQRKSVPSSIESTNRRPSPKFLYKSNLLKAPKRHSMAETGNGTFAAGPRLVPAKQLHRQAMGALAAVSMVRRRFALGDARCASGGPFSHCLTMPHLTPFAPARLALPGCARSSCRADAQRQQDRSDADRACAPWLCQR